MIFKKKKRMVDIRELQKRGVVRMPRKEIVIPTNQDGFVELGNGSKTADNNANSQDSSNTEFFGFMDSASPSTSTNRDESERITNLDNKIYKLEQRIELLEKKLDVNQSSEPSVGVMGW